MYFIKGLLCVDCPLFLTVVCLFIALQPGYGHINPHSEGSFFHPGEYNHQREPHSSLAVPFFPLGRPFLPPERYQFPEGFPHHPGGPLPPRDDPIEGSNGRPKRVGGVQDPVKILLDRTDLNYRQPRPYLNNDTYTYESGRSIELTCYHVEKTRLEWMDDSLFTTGTREINGSTAIRIKITLDKYDNNTKLYCKAHDPENEVYINLSANPKYYFPEIDETLIEVKKNTFLNASCNGLLYYPGQSISTSKVFFNEKITDNFKKTDNGTTVLCVEFEPIRNEKDNYRKKVYTYERKKAKYVYIIDGTDTMDDDIIPVQVGGALRKGKRFTVSRMKNKLVQKLATLKKDMIKELKGSLALEFRKELTAITAKYDLLEGSHLKLQDEHGKLRNDFDNLHKKLVEDRDTKTKVIIITVSAGGVILVLLSIIAIIYYSNKRGSSDYDDTDEVIYAEIDELPRRKLPSLPTIYAKILVNLVPKLSGTKEEHVYCTMG